MTDVVVDAVRLRGPHARRLARVAARALPTALERALTDAGDVHVDRVDVTLDPGDHDDDTLAVLWADLIRAELLRTSGRRTAAGSAAPPQRPDLAAAGAAGPLLDEVQAARTWLSAEPETRPAVPGALLRLAVPTTAARVAAGLGPVLWPRLLAALSASLRAPDRAVRSPTAGPTTPGVGPDPGRPGPPVVGSMPPRRPEWPSGGEGAEPGDVTVAGPATGVLATLGALADLRADDAGPLDPATVTRAGGLALLYPWLADHCRRAVDLHPGLDVVDVREVALAAVLGDPATVDDPLVGFLAGRDGPARPRRRTPLRHQEEVADSATRVVSALVALLPGFERSTPGFVREAWLVRWGLLDTRRDPALLTAATHPLDVVLTLLPYPLGLLKLPWSPPLSVRSRR